MTYSPADSRIVVGVDGSAASDAAVRWAVREARLRHATVHLVSAYHSDSRQRAQYVPSSWTAPQEERSAAAEALVAAAMELARRSLPPGQLTAELANEPPARALLDRAADAELLVLGTTRPAPRPGQPPQSMGPVARACLTLAHCPVVIVSPDDRPARDLTAGQGEQDAASRQAARGQQPGIRREQAGLRQVPAVDAPWSAMSAMSAKASSPPRPGGEVRDSPHRGEQDF